MTNERQRKKDEKDREADLRQGRGYVVFSFSNKHKIVITRYTDRGWVAKDKILSPTIKVGGEALFTTIRACTAETMTEALDGILEEI